MLPKTPEQLTPTPETTSPELSPEARSRIREIDNELKQLAERKEEIRKTYLKIKEDPKIPTDEQLAQIKQELIELKERKEELEREKDRLRGKEIIKAKTLEAKEIFGQDALGPEEVKNAFGIELDPKDIPEIPYSREDLEKAKKLGEMLVLRTDKAPDGEPLTMKKINELLIDEFEKGSKGRIFYEVDKDFSKEWYKNEDFFTKDTPKLSWALVSKEILPNSASKTWNQQEELLKEYIKENNLDPEKVRRRTPVEVMYDILLYYQNTGQRLLEDRYDWTVGRDSGGELVGVGGFGSGGTAVGGFLPGFSHDSLGVCSSR